ncbi:mid region of cactin-domain-containing protein [Lentinula lateritia]|nr:mid region of cactin-domain-containing protein [Lentinula lateritia]
MGRHSSRSISPYGRSNRNRVRDGTDQDRESRTEHREEDRKRYRSRSRDRDEVKDYSSSRRDQDSSKHSERDRSFTRDRDKKRRKRDKSEERKARKAEKKRIKEEEEARQIAELSVYSATDNPFHDVNLGQQFRWHKKNEKERKQGLSLAEAQRKDGIRRQEAKEELERLNKRRAEREVEQRLREEEEMRMQRLQESAQMSDWLSKEGDFQLEQERSRAAIRIKEKRAKAVDFLALNLKYVTLDDDSEDEEEDAGLEIDLDEPYNILDNLNNEQVEELHDDIERYMTLEQNDTNIDFWTNMMVVCKDRLDSIKSGQRMGIEAAKVVENDIAALLSGKTYNELASLQRQIQNKLTSGEPVDTDYWEALLKKILVWKAKANLKSLHEVVVRNRLEQLRKRQRDEALLAQEELLAGVAKTASSGPVPIPESTVTLEPEMALIEPYDRSMSPTLIDITKLPTEERQIDIFTVDEDWRALMKLRRTVAASRFVPKLTQPEPETQDEEAIASGADMASEALYRAEAERELDEEEELFNMEENIANPTSYNWEDKYRPRKPRYFNRVHTGYEWNKYNQTHYDTDNPPPKVVQGYKFNVFYPDLIDKSKAPTYKIVKEPGNDETVLLLFSAGPPYEDIAFRIVNREWEFSHKRGFRSSFDRGCLSLWFNFRRNVRIRCLPCSSHWFNSYPPVLPQVGRSVH